MLLRKNQRKAKKEKTAMQAGRESLKAELKKAEHNETVYEKKVGALENAEVDERGVYYIKNVKKEAGEIVFWPGDSCHLNRKELEMELAKSKDRLWYARSEKKRIIDCLR